ncbi:MAG: Maf family protein, partial [Candidatus Methylomirabilia bacterium]
AYAVQGHGGRLVAQVDGCYTNVVGLPLTTTRRLLAAWGLP